MKLAILAVLGSAAVVWWLNGRAKREGQFVTAMKIEAWRGAAPRYTYTQTAMTEEERRRKAMIPPVRRISLARRAS